MFEQYASRKSIPIYPDFQQLVHKPSQYL